jgi:hypothetical protein
MSGRHDASAPITSNPQKDNERAREAPNPKPQAPEKFQIPVAKVLIVHLWSLALWVSLEFGVWDLVLFTLAPP